MSSVLFVCTGNIFRSVTAEYALRRTLGGQTGFSVSSAGTAHAPGAVVRDDVAAYLLAAGLDVSDHRRRTVDERIVRDADLVIAMSTDHLAFLRERLATEATLFSEACGAAPTPLPDIDDLFAPEDWHGPEAIRHIRRTIDRIIDLTPRLGDRLIAGWRGG